MKQTMESIGKKLHAGELHAWHIGLLLAGYNTLLLLGIGLLAVVSTSLLPIWELVYMLSPFLFVAFWLWFTQHILHIYKKIPLHDVLLIAKFGVFPFIFIFVASVLIMDIAMSLPIIGSFWAIIAYYTLFLSSGAIFLGFTVTVFGLRHHIRISTIHDQKKA